MCVFVRACGRAGGRVCVHVYQSKFLSLCAGERFKSLWVCVHVKGLSVRVVVQVKGLSVWFCVQVKVLKGITTRN